MLKGGRSNPMPFFIIFTRQPNGPLYPVACYTRWPVTPGGPLYLMARYNHWHGIPNLLPNSTVFDKFHPVCSDKILARIFDLGSAVTYVKNLQEFDQRPSLARPCSPHGLGDSLQLLLDVRISWVAMQLNK